MTTAVAAAVHRQQTGSGLGASSRVMDVNNHHDSDDYPGAIRPAANPENRRAAYAAARNGVYSKSFSVAREAATKPQKTVSRGRPKNRKEELQIRLKPRYMIDPRTSKFMSYWDVMTTVRYVWAWSCVRCRIGVCELGAGLELGRPGNDGAQAVVAQRGERGGSGLTTLRSALRSWRCSSLRPSRRTRSHSCDHRRASHPRSWCARH